MNTTDDFKVPHGSGTPCRLERGDGDCPVRETCYEEQEGVVEPGSRCSCWAFYGHGGDNCDQLTAGSFLTGTLFALTTIYLVYVVGNNYKTLWKCNTAMRQGKLKVNAALTTLVFGTLASTTTLVMTLGYVGAAFLIDKDMVFEDIYGWLVALQGATITPTTMNVSILWVDLVYKSSKGTAAAGSKVKKMMITACFIVTVLFMAGCFIFASTGNRRAMGLMSTVSCIAFGVSYGVGGHKLNKMFQKSAAARGKSEAVEASPWCDIRFSGDTPEDMIVLTANNMTRVCALQFCGIVLYVMNATSFTPLMSVGVWGIFQGLAMITHIVCNYCRFGLRKALGIKFRGRRGTIATTTTTTTEDGSSKRRSFGRAGSSVTPDTK